MSYSQSKFAAQYTRTTICLRMFINERRMDILPMSESEREALRLKHQTRDLTMIPPRGHTDFYRDFNGSGPQEVRRLSEEYKRVYMIVSLDGYIDATNGTRAERLACDISAGPSELAIKTPVRWSPVPVGGVVIQPD